MKKSREIAIWTSGRDSSSLFLPSCAIEPEHSQLRFIAIRSAGDALVERIYEEGGLACPDCGMTLAESKPGTQL